MKTRRWVCGLWLGLSLSLVGLWPGQAMAQAGIRQARDVHFVQIKCPLLTAERVLEATARRTMPRTPSSSAALSASIRARHRSVLRALTGARARRNSVTWPWTRVSTREAVDDMARYPGTRQSL